ncbi:uncharacterized protein METZ01_LOCUS136932, partial [marine metagenome]
LIVYIVIMYFYYFTYKILFIMHFSFLGPSHNYNLSAHL